jgi:hypothetical protein
MRQAHEFKTLGEHANLMGIPHKVQQRMKKRSLASTSINNSPHSPRVYFDFQSSVSTSHAKYTGNLLSSRAYPPAFLTASQGNLPQWRISESQ